MSESRSSDTDARAASPQPDQARFADSRRRPLIAPNTLDRITLQGPTPSAPMRYGVAVLATVIAVAGTELLVPLFGRHLWLLFFAAVALAAWMGGRRASLVATVLSLLASNYLFLEPVGSLKLGSRADIAYMLMFGIIAVFIGFVISSLRYTRADARLAGDEATRVRSHVEAILDNLPDAATAFDKQWRYVYMNRVGEEFLRTSGVDPQSARGRILWEVLPDLDASLRDNLKKAMSESASAEFESWYPRIDRWYENRVAPTVDGIVVLSRDITDRKKTEAEQSFLAEASDALYTSLDFRQTLDTVANLAIKWIADGSAVDLVRPDGGTDRIATASRIPETAALAAEIERRWPLAAESPYGFPHVIRTATAELTPEITDEILRAVSQSDEHYEMFRKLGMQSVMTVPLIGRERVLGALTFVALGPKGRKPFTQRDLAVAQELARRASLAIENAQSFQEMQRARAEAEHANRAKLEFLTTMSHELRTPLNAIAGYAELLALGVRGPVTPQQTEDLGRIQRSQRYLLALINDLLNFAKIETGKVDFNFREVKVAEAMAGMEALIAPQVMAKGLHYRFRCDVDGNVTVTADSDKLQQIILNLLSNAVKFTPAGGTVSLDCDATATHVLIRVTDTGPGIPANKLESVFEPFVQIDRSLTNTGTGVGLGLSISRDLARRMGGDVTVESQLGQGAEFTVSIPRAQ